MEALPNRVAGALLIWEYVGTIKVIETIIRINRISVNLPN